MVTAILKQLVKIFIFGFLMLIFNGCNTLKVENTVAHNINNQKLTAIEIQWNKPQSLELSVTIVTSIYAPRRGISLEEREYHLQKFGKLNKTLKKDVPLLLQEKLKKKNVKVDDNAPIILSMTPTMYSRKKMTLHTILIQKVDKKVLWQSDLNIPLMYEVLILNVPKEQSKITDSIVELIIKSLTDAKYFKNDLLEEGSI